MAKSLFVVEVVTQERPHTLMSLYGKTSITDSTTSTSWKTWLKVERSRRGNGKQRGKQLRTPFTMPSRKVARRKGARSERRGSRPATSARRRNHALRASQ